MTTVRTLGWGDLRRLGKQDNAGRWYPCDAIDDYFVGYRHPSRAWPYSYAHAAMTQKFARWLIANRPALAREHGLISAEQVPA